MPSAASFILPGGVELERHAMERSQLAMNPMETNPATRTVASTQSEMTEIILPNDTNPLGNLLGGRLMHFIDVTGAMAAYRHARTYIVTAAMDHIDFIRPVHLGHLVTLRSSVNRAFSTSMEVGVKAWAEDTQTGVQQHVASAYLVFVAINKDGKRMRVPELIPETPDEKRRYADALLRREHREAEAVRRKQETLAHDTQENAKA
jgi:acyl-CoA hydrolase